VAGGRVNRSSIKRDLILRLSLDRGRRPRKPVEHKAEGCGPPPPSFGAKGGGRSKDRYPRMLRDGANAPPRHEDVLVGAGAQ